MRDAHCLPKAVHAKAEVSVGFVAAFDLCLLRFFARCFPPFFPLPPSRLCDIVGASLFD